MTNIWKRADAREDHVSVLVVLTGNANDRYIHSDVYDFVVCVTWAHNHETDPDWLARYLVEIASAAKACEAGLTAIDVLGISRGHSALMASCKRTPEMLHLELADEFRYFLAGGG